MAVQSGNSVVDFAQTLSSLGPLLFGSGTTTEKTTPGNMTDYTTLLNSILPTINDPSVTDGIVQNIIRQTQLKFAPISFAGNNASGLYGSSNVAAMQGQFMADAVGQSSSAVLKARQDAMATAAGLVNNQSRATTSTSKSTTPGISPAISGGIAAAMIAKSAFAKKKNEDGSSPSSPPGTSDIFDAVSGRTVAQDAGTAGQSVGGTTQTLGNVEEGLVSSADAISNSSAFDAASIYEGGGEAASSLTGTATAEEAASFFGGEGAADVIGGSVGVDSLLGGAAGDGLIEAAGGGLLEELGPLAIAAWVICTELNKQKRLPNKWYVAGARVFAAYKEEYKPGYYLWAIPSVRHLRKYPDSRYSKFLEVIFNWRAEYLASQVGVRGARKQWRGWFVTTATYYFSVALAKTLARKPVDWTVLYKEQR